MIASRYTLEREIGRGGMGAVWLGHDDLLGRKVALKRIGVAPGGTDPELARAEREARLAASLSHANVVSVFDLAPDGDVQWLVMEYVDGIDLAAMVRDRGALSPDETAPILAQVAAALAAAHAAGVVHRDVKPSNILVTPTGQVKLSDFGIARIQGDPSLTQTGLVTGSPAYLSPEVASGGSASYKSDVWSLGASAYHVLEGRPPYDVGDNLVGALYRIVHEDTPRPTSPGWLEPLIDGCLQHDEAARWDAADVERFLAEGPPAASAVPSYPPRAKRANRSSRGVAAEPTAFATQMMPPTGDPMPPAADRGQRRRRSSLLLPWLITGLLVALVAMVALLATSVLGGEEPDRDVTATDPVTSSAPSPSASDPATTAPTVQSMTSFITDYVTNAPIDPSSTFNELTADFQAASGGLEGYTAFWGPVDDVKLGPVQADPSNLTVTYQYQFRRNGRSNNQNVTLQLTFEDGQYLIADEV